MKKLIFLTLFLLLPVSTYAQNPSDSDVDLMQRAEMVAEIKKLRAESSGKDKLIEVQKTQIDDLHTLNKTQEGRIADLKDANANCHQAVEISPKIEKLYDERIADYKAENQRLRDENTKLRKSRDRGNLIFGAIGTILGGLLF